MFIGSGESIQSIQSSQPISICTIFWFIIYFSYLLHQWEKMNSWKTPKVNKSNTLTFWESKSSLRTCWRFKIETTGKKTKPTSQKLSIFEAKSRKTQKNNFKKKRKVQKSEMSKSRKKKKTKSQKVDKSKSSQAKRFMFEKYRKVKKKRKVEKRKTF
jgi:hypothetical protein